MKIFEQARGQATGIKLLTGQEPVKLHQELEVHIVALGRLAVGAAHVVTIEINAYSEWKRKKAMVSFFMFKHALSRVKKKRRIRKEKKTSKWFLLFLFFLSFFLFFFPLAQRIEEEN